MGILKKIGKRFKRIIRGVKKLFSKSIAGKLFGSKFGKILMLVAGIFTMGMALAAGVAAWNTAALAGKGLIGKFMAAGGDFIRTLVGMKAKHGVASRGVTSGGEALSAAQTQAAGAVQASGVEGAALTEGTLGVGGAPIAETAAAATEGLMGGGPLTGAGGGTAIGAPMNPANIPNAASQIITPGGGGGGGGLLQGGKDLISGVMKGATGQPLGPSPAGTGPAGAIGSAAGAAGEAIGVAIPAIAQPSMATQAGGLLGQAARGVGKFAMSPGGGKIIGSMLEGYATAKAEEERLKEERRQSAKMDVRWKNYRWQDEDFEIGLGPGWAQRASRVREQAIHERHGFPTQRPQPA